MDKLQTESAVLPTDADVFRGMVNALRDVLKIDARTIKALKEHQHLQNECSKSEDRGEVFANIMLAYRHAEDARMRLGKVLQAMSDVAPWDKK